MHTSMQPAHLLRPLLSDLVRWDDSFARAWGTSPSRAYVASFDDLQGRVLRVAESLRTSAFDEMRPVGASLERQSAYMTSVATRLSGMSARGITFGAGWERVLDQAISDVRYGLQLLGVEPYPGQPAPWPPHPDPYPPQHPSPYPPPYPDPYPPVPGQGWPYPTPYQSTAE